MNNIPDSQAIVEISSDFLQDLCSQAESADNSDMSKSPAGISIAAGTLTTVNTLSARTVASLIRYIVGQRRPPKGSVVVLDRDLGTISKRDILKLRRRMGIVGGEFGLISELNVTQNLALPCLVRKLGSKQTQMRIERIAEALQLDDLLSQPVSHLGAIERGVIMIARALTHDPELIVLEAPLSGLDKHWSSVIVEHFQRSAVTGSTALFFHEYTGAFDKGNTDKTDSGRSNTDRSNTATADQETNTENSVDSNGFDRGAFGKNMSQS